MANSFTANLGLTKPEVGADTNLWGGHLNGDMDAIDGIFTSASTRPVSIILRSDMSFVDAVTTSKSMLFSLTNLTTSTPRTLTVRDASGQVAIEPILRGYLGGLTTSNDAVSTTTKLDVAAGVCMDDTNASMLSLGANVINCGVTGANGLDTGSLGASTWYHVFAIGTAGAVTTAALASTNVSSPSMPGTYTLKRRIGSFKTDGSSHILAFVQDGDLFQWVAPVTQDVSTTNPGTSAVTTSALSVPPGLSVIAHIQPVIVNASNGGVVYSYFSDLATNDVLPVAATGFFDNATVDNVAAGVVGWGARMFVRTSTAAKIRYRLSYSDANVGVTINTLGWTDTRGRNL